MHSSMNDVFLVALQPEICFQMPLRHLCNETLGVLHTVHEGVSTIQAPHFAVAGSSEWCVPSCDTQYTASNLRKHCYRPT